MKPKAVSSTKMKCAIDVFVKTGDDTYHTLVRIDTSLSDIRRPDHNTENIINQALTVVSHAGTSGIHMGHYKSKKPVAFGTIIDGYNRIFNLPVLSTQIHKKGIYIN